MTSNTVQDSIFTEIHIGAAPERVFNALVDPSQVPQWWGQKQVYRCTEFKADLRVGGAWRSSGIGADGGPFEVNGKFLEIDPPRVLAYTWISSWTGPIRTTVRWEITPQAEGTRVVVTHSGLAQCPELAQSYRGWPRMLQWLHDYLEKGETVETRI